METTMLSFSYCCYMLL